MLNRFVVYIIIFQSILCLIIAFVCAYYYSNEGQLHHYLPFETLVTVEGILTFFRYFLLLNTFLPISLIVSLEVCKVVQSGFIMTDVKMVTREPKGQARSASVFQTNIIEELGQISYLFSDKTGTLTRNVMTFKALCIGGDEGG